MNERKVFVAGLNFEIDSDDLGRIFGKYGNVDEAKVWGGDGSRLLRGDGLILAEHFVVVQVILDRETQKSRGFGFVKFADTEVKACHDAIDDLNQRELDGRETPCSPPCTHPFLDLGMLSWHSRRVSRAGDRQACGRETRRAERAAAELHRRPAS